MADRRMFSKRIINTARFLTMPLSTQALYFHLGLAADDDGVVEAFTTMRQVMASQDDLRILVAKGFVKLLNDDMVAYIMDWRENNKIRADRKTDSLYKDLLLKVVPDAELLAPRQRADAKKQDTGCPVDVQRTTDGRHRIGKDRVGEDRLGEGSNNPLPPTATAPGVPNPFVLWNSNICPMTAILSEKLQSLVEEVGELPVCQAIESAVLNGVRNFNYVQAAARGIARGETKQSKSSNSPRKEKNDVEGAYNEMMAAFGGESNG